MSGRNSNLWLLQSITKLGRGPYRTRKPYGSLMSLWKTVLSEFSPSGKMKPRTVEHPKSGLCALIFGWTLSAAEWLSCLP